MGALTSDDIASAFAAFFHRGDGPSHAAVTRVLVRAGLSDGYVYDPDHPGPNKETRVLSAFNLAKRQGGARELVEGLLSLLRHMALVGAAVEKRDENEQRLRSAFNRSGWALTEDGLLVSPVGADLDSGGRPALDETLARLRSSGADPALAIGTAKDLLESVAKFVLEELGIGVDARMDFNALWHIARERLGVLPQQVDQSLPGYRQIRAVHQSSWQIAESINELRNLQGTGHGRTLPTGVTEDLAMLVVREACSVAEYMLRRLDREHGRE